MLYNTYVVGFQNLPDGKIFRNAAEFVIVGTPLTLYGLEKDGVLAEAFKNNEPVVKTAKASNAFAIVNFSMSVALNFVMALKNTGTSVPWLENVTLGVIFFGGAGLWLATTKYLQSMRTGLVQAAFAGGRATSGACDHMTQVEFDAKARAVLPIF
jgi:hypothetical protein